MINAIQFFDRADQSLGSNILTIRHRLRLDEIGRKESQRYHHIDLTRTASLAFGDAVGCGGAIIDKLLEPTAPLRNRSNQRPFRIGANGTRMLLR